MKKAGKTTRSFKYDLNQIPYDYIVEVRNRFKGLDQIDGVPDELWMEVCDIVQESVIKTIPKKKKCKKAKWLSEEALQIARKEEKLKAKKKTKIMASGHYFMGNRWRNSGNSVRLYFGGSKITTDGDGSHEIKRHSLEGTL